MNLNKREWNETDVLVAFEHLRDEDVALLTREDVERFGFFGKRITEKELENGSLELSIEDKSIIVDKATEYAFDEKKKRISFEELNNMLSEKVENYMSDKLLIIVDPQNDFISGSLAVEGADKCMDLLTRYIGENEFYQIWVSLDWHSHDHCSFVEQGGEWPSHCVEGTFGSKMYEPLMSTLVRKKPHFIPYKKGQTIEEYSIFARKDVKLLFKHLIPKLPCSEIILCGIMGRVCVLNTLKDLVDMNVPQTIIVNLDFTADDDNNETIIKYCEENNIKYIKS